jgi:hypothetical protein
MYTQDDIENTQREDRRHGELQSGSHPSRPYLAELRGAEFRSMLPESISEADDITLNRIKLALECDDAPGLLAVIKTQFDEYTDSVADYWR